ncbi:hypothetical protein ZIOFF_020779 [Zingiber officinale]|uniref:Radical SAM core domain-containing protein n=1 Tax=Zingiber officinale TaxID=94328 RepID=A0A8J5H0M7_ZINOF|nr:hypothetical protein ZIOFF_020779 [Zingiber officinale]
MAPARGVGGDSAPAAKDEQRSDPCEIGFRGSQLEFTASISAGLRLNDIKEEEGWNWMTIKRRRRTTVPFGYSSRCLSMAVLIRWTAYSLSSMYLGLGDPRSSKVTLKGMDFRELENWVQSQGFRSGQALMLWKCLYGNNSWAQSCDELTGLAQIKANFNSRSHRPMNNLLVFEGPAVFDLLLRLNKEFRKMLSANVSLTALSLKEVLTASDGTRKVISFKINFGSHRSLQILFTLEEGSVIETVVIPCRQGRTTVCVSSQIGCAMNCQFCYTGRHVHFSFFFLFNIESAKSNLYLIYLRMGLKRHLSTAEIVEQAVFARRLFTSELGSITNVVFMGMGEPLHNIDNVIKAAAIMVHDQGLHFSPRKVTVSTSGLVPQLKRFLRESPCALAVSLNATTDEVRNWIMPINMKYKLSLLLNTLKEELSSKHKYKVLFEYVMLAGVNDSIEDSKRLIELVRGIPCKINLISFNPHCGTLFKPTAKDKMIEFRNVLAEAGIAVFLRLSRGDDKMAACGQLGKPGDVQAPLLRVPGRFQMAV